jgi:hypothetical protein
MIGKYKFLDTSKILALAEGKMKFCILFSILVSCNMDTTENRMITFYNKHSEIYYCFFYNKELSLEGYYLDKHNFHPELVKQDSKCLLDIVRPRWETYINQSSDKKLKIYVVAKDSVDKYGWKNIFAKNTFNKKYNLTIDNLEKLDWGIVYN